MRHFTHKEEVITSSLNFRPGQILWTNDDLWPTYMDVNGELCLVVGQINSYTYIVRYTTPSGDRYGTVISTD